MDYDPVNRDVPAPRYELESGSEDELEGPAPKTQEPFSIATADGDDTSSKLEQDTRLVVLVGHAGAALLSSLQGAAPAQRFTLRTSTEQYGALAVLDSTSGTKITVALLAPPPQLRPSRFHEIADRLVESTRPSSIVILDSYSPQEQLYRGVDGADDHEGAATPIRYLSTPSYLAEQKVDTSRMQPLRSPESATGLGAALLSKVSRSFEDCSSVSTLFAHQVF